MDSNKHIVWIVPGFSASDKDNTCIPTLLDFLQFIISTKNVTISIICLNYPFSGEPYKIFGANVYPMNGQNKWYKKPGIWKRSLQTLKQLHEQNPIHLIHSFWLGDTAIIGEAFAQQNKIKHICTLMGQDALKDNRHLNNKRLFALNTVAISKIQAETYFRNTGRKPSHIIPWALPKQNILSDSKQYDIIGIGNLIPVKNYEMWIKIIQLVKLEIPKVKAILIGDGSQRPELESLIEKQYLTNSIQLIGHLDRNITMKHLASAKIFLHTAKFEGQGYVLMEAMSQQIPILSTPVGHAVENEKIWKGIDPTEFASEIIKILRKKEVPITYDAPEITNTWEGYSSYYH